MIEFRGNYTREEWMRGIALATQPRGLWLALRLVGAALFLAAVGLAVYALVSGALDPLRIGRHAVTAILLGYWTAYPFIRGRVAAARQWKRGHGELSLAGTVDNQGIKINATQQVDRWDSFLRLIRREDMMVLVGSDGLATVLPRRFFDERGWRDFAALAQYKVVEPK